MVTALKSWTGSVESAVAPLGGDWEEAQRESLRRIEATAPRDTWLNGNVLSRAFDFLLLHFPGDREEIQQQWTPLEIVDFYLNAT